MDPVIDRFEDDEIADVQPLSWLWVERIIALALVIFGLFDFYMSCESFGDDFENDLGNWRMILVDFHSLLRSVMLTLGAILLLMKKRTGYIFSQIAIINFILVLLAMYFGPGAPPSGNLLSVIIFLLILGIVEYLITRSEIKNFTT